MTAGNHVSGSSSDRRATKSALHSFCLRPAGAPPAPRLRHQDLRRSPLSLVVLSVAQSVTRARFAWQPSSPVE